MEYFCIVEWEDYEEERLPRLPDDIPFLLLAGSPENSDWALFECDFPEDYEFTNSEVELVSEELEILLFSAKSYPPALALAREDIELYSTKLDNFDKTIFLEVYTDILRKHLQLQKNLPYFLAEAKISDFDYLVKGAFYWIIGYDPESDEVRWVSEDYFVHSSPASDFGLEAKKLRYIFSQ